MIKYFAFSFSTADGWVDGGWYCCTSSNLCGADQGDCDVDSECAGSLICGTNNCPSGFYYSGFDCCKRNPIGKYQKSSLGDPEVVAIAIYMFQFT